MNLLLITPFRFHDSICALRCLPLVLFMLCFALVPKTAAKPADLSIFVSVLAPTEGAAFKSDSTIHLAATAVEPRSGIRKVDYYDGANWIASSIERGFRAIWRNPLPGNHYVVAVATDFRGMTATSSQVHIVVLPANDNFSAATKLAGTHVSIMGSTFGATLQPGETDWIGGGPSVWYSWKAPADGRVYLAMPNWPWGVYFGAFTGNSVTNLTELGHDLPFDGWETAYFYFEVHAGTTYHIVAAQFGTELAPFTLNLDFLPKPANDDFQHRAVIPAHGGSATVDTFSATFQPSEPIDLATDVVGWTPSLHTVWWTWTAPTGGRVTIQPSSNFLYLLGVYHGLSLSNLTTIAQTINCGVTLDVATGTQLQISVDGANGQSGFLNLNLNFVPSPANDNFKNAEWAFGLTPTLQGNNVAATAEPGEPHHAGVGDGHSVWWKWVAPTTGYAVLSFASNSAPCVAAVYTGQVLSNLTAQASMATGTVGFDTVKETTYYIAVDGTSGREGAFTLNLLLSTIRLIQPTAGAKFYVGAPIKLAASTTSLDGNGTSVDFYAGDQFLGSAPKTPHPAIIWTNAGLGSYPLTARITDRRGLTRSSEPVNIRVRPGNDDFTNAIQLQGLVVSTNGTNLGSGKEPGEPTASDPSADASVWYAWTAPASGEAVVSVQEDYFGGHPVGVYLGNSVSNLVALGESIYDFYPVSFVAHAGVTYYIEVSGFSQNIPNGYGPFGLGITQTPAPANDDFANRITLSGSSVSATGSNIGATSEPGDGGGASVWWTWTAPGTGSFFVTASGDTLGPVFSIFTGNSISNLNSVAGIGPSWFYGTDTSGQIHVEQGQVYQIEMTGTYTHPSGNVSLALSFVPSPPNDDFINSIPLAGLLAVSVSSNDTASVESGEPLSNGRTVWWRWTAPVTGPVCLGTSGSSFSPLLSVYTGRILTNLVLETTGLSDLQFNSVAGTTYQILADANNGGQVGHIQLTLVAGVPANDQFANRLTLTGTNVSVTASTSGATREVSEPVHGGFQGSNSIWYSWIAPAAGTLTITATGDGFSPTWAVYTGSSLSALSDVANSYIWPWNIRSSGSFPVLPGVPLQIAIDGALSAGGGPAGIVSLNLSFAGLPGNDNFANRSVISGTSIHVSGTTSGATREPGEPDHDGYPGGHSIWWSWTAPTSGQVTLDAAGSSVTTLIAVYTGTNVASLTSVAGGNASFAPVIFNCRVGEAYQIALDHWYSDIFGAVNLNLLFSSIQLTAPTNEAVFHAPAEIVLAATNTIWDGTFTTIEFLADGNVIGTAASAAPQTFHWLNPPLGDHALQARATDTNGITRTSPTITVHLRPTNDDFGDRTLISGNNAVLHADGVNATLESGEPQHGPVNWESVWWTWTATANGSVTLSKPVASNLRNVLLDVYTGAALTNLTLVTNTPANGSGTDTTTITFNARPSVDYQITVAGSFFDQNDVPIMFSFTPAATSENSATPLSGISAALPVIGGPQRQSFSRFRFAITGTAGSNYTILCTTNLLLPITNWSTLLITNLSGNSAIIEDDRATNALFYYRVKSGP